MFRALATRHAHLGTRLVRFLATDLLAGAAALPPHAITDTRLAFFVIAPVAVVFATPFVTLARDGVRVKARLPEALARLA